jgi:hypothetical protein
MFHLGVGLGPQQNDELNATTRTGQRWKSRGAAVQLEHGEKINYFEAMLCRQVASAGI